MDHPSPLSSRPQGLRAGRHRAPDALIDAWLMAHAPLAVPEASRPQAVAGSTSWRRVRQGLCLIDGTISRCWKLWAARRAPTRCVVCYRSTLIHSLSTGGRACAGGGVVGAAALDDLAASAASLAACCDVLVDWCRAHEVSVVWLAPGLLPLRSRSRAPRGFAPGADGLLHRAASCRRPSSSADLGIDPNPATGRLSRPTLIVAPAPLRVNPAFSYEIAV